MKLNKLNKKGFTIVELLIVIVIIGILATIGFVAFSGAQNKAKKSKAESTVSNVKAKLGEYYATKSEYPADKDAVVAYLDGSDGNDGGKNTDLATTFDDSDDYDYACNAVADGGCASGFTLTAQDTLWGGKPAGDVVVTN
jgi:prepilin-type N-terminal cleavage/methylation domain-containing protein